ncbi:MAG TPA: class I SAM-dependent methyltransferase [Verrucomicrobiae bacterium]|nr:class I SAM-dependent methyltransferase [Verrucomicrobiae bacterium]
MTTSAIPDPAPVLDLIEAFRRSQTMFTAVSLGIFDALETAPAGAEVLAAQLKLNSDALERLLDGCAALGLLEKRDGVYHNAAVASRYLCTSSPHSMHGYVLYSREALYAMWGHLDEAIREGTHRWTQTFGLEAPLFSHFFRTDAAMRDFLMGMHGFGMVTSPRIAAAFDLSRFRRLADLGGATGHLAIAACERYPDLHAIVFDLPRAAALAREQVALSPAAGRIEIVSGDFFHDPLPPADLYTLGRILHDWDEPKIMLLLEKVRRALPPGGALLIAEKHLNPDGVGPLPANMQSLNMLICTEGKERSAEQYAVLLRRAGFDRIESRRTGVALDAILAS